MGKFIKDLWVVFPADLPLTKFGKTKVENSGNYR